ncbi:MAG: murein L,D-transpeptidase catalytic domain family protein [Bdellovibrionales bacterium]
MRRLLLLVPFFLLSACSQNSTSLTDFAALPDETGQENPDQNLITPDVLARGLKVQSLGWREPSYTKKETAAILKQYDHLDPSKEVPTGVLTKAILFFHANRDLIPNKTYLTAVDFSRHSRRARLFLINMEDGSVLSLHTSHGKGSDTNNDGYAERFGNTPESGKTSLGFYLTAETYQGKNGYSLRLDGLSKSNSNVRSRAVVMHTGDYVVEQPVKQGRSLGCLVIAREYHEQIIDLVKEGSLIYVGRSEYD